MKTYIIAAICAVSFAGSALAQGNAESKSASAAVASTSSGAQAGAAVILNQVAPEKQTIIAAPGGITGPSIIGGHPCMRAQSGGVTGIFSGTPLGLSYGQTTVEASCMLKYLGQDEAAIRALAATSPAACEALNNVGYYTVFVNSKQYKAVPFACGKKTVRGGALTAGSTVSTRNAPSSSPRPVARGQAYEKCAKEDGKVVFRTRYGYESAAARSQCLSVLGY